MQRLKIPPLSCKPAWCGRQFNIGTALSYVLDIANWKYGSHRQHMKVTWNMSRHQHCVTVHNATAAVLPRGYVPEDISASVVVVPLGCCCHLYVVWTLRHIMLKTTCVSFVGSCASKMRTSCSYSEYPKFDSQPGFCLFCECSVLFNTFDSSQNYLNSSFIIILIQAAVAVHLLFMRLYLFYYPGSLQLAKIEILVYCI